MEAKVTLIVLYCRKLYCEWPDLSVCGKFVMRKLQDPSFNLGNFRFSCFLLAGIVVKNKLVQFFESWFVHEFRLQIVHYPESVNLQENLYSFSDSIQKLTDLQKNRINMNLWPHPDKKASESSNLAYLICFKTRTEQVLCSTIPIIVQGWYYLHSQEANTFPTVNPIQLGIIVRKHRNLRGRPHRVRTHAASRYLRIWIKWVKWIEWNVSLMNLALRFEKCIFCLFWGADLRKMAITGWVMERLHQIFARD